MQRKYQICTRCVMDTTDPDIIFDENGYCNHCNRAIKNFITYYHDENKKQEKLKEIVKKVKKDGKGKSYDCIIGMSGGIDSSYLAYILVKKFNIRPLAIHVDNGWNSGIAVANIHALVNQLKIDLVTHVIDWTEFKELQKSFLRASVIDLEMLSDHAIVVKINKIAQKKEIGYFLIGGNFQTESIMPYRWFYSNKRDSKNILDIYKKYGSNQKLKTFPLLSFWGYLTFAKKYGKYMAPLSYLEYNKDIAKALLKKEFGWQDYGAKHHESFITKFYQNYILPNKFGVDKRKSHLSSLICANQISRESALVELKKPLWKNDYEEKEVVDYFCKKMELSVEQFEKIMQKPRKEHDDFKTYAKTKIRIVNVAKRILFKK